MAVSEVSVSGDTCQSWQAFPSGKRKSCISSEVVHVENLFGFAGLTLYMCIHMAMILLISAEKLWKRSIQVLWRCIVAISRLLKVTAVFSNFPSFYFYFF